MILAVGTVVCFLFILAIALIVESRWPGCDCLGCSKYSRDRFEGTFP